MRYADEPTVEVELRVAASPEQVWDVVSDISLPVRFSDELEGVAWIDGATGPAVGARFVGRSRHPAIGAWATTCVVCEYEPTRRFGWNVEFSAGISSSWRFELMADGDGTVVRQWGRMGPAPSGLNMAIEAMPDKEDRIVARRLQEWERNMTANLEGIKTLVEST